jgi:hypothetical protein
MLVLKNSIYVGSIKDVDGIWHPVISSPDEDFVQLYCTRIAERENNGFFTDVYTVEIVPYIIPSGDLLDEWGVSFEEIEDEELFSEVDGSPVE